jgi:arylsulfatase A-like enzyme
VTTDAPREPPRVPAAARYALLWVVPALVLRALVWSAGAGATPSLGLLAPTLIVSAAQDLVLACEVLLVLLLLWRATDRARRTWRAAHAFAFALFLGWALFDALLSWKIGVRLDPGLVYLFGDAPAFFASARATGGLPVLIAGGALVLAAATIALPRLVPAPPIPSARDGWVAGLALVASGVSLLALPTPPHDARDNLLVRAQANGLRALGQSLSTTDVASAVRAAGSELHPRAQSWVPLSRDYPLLKRTTGFAGDTLFDVRVDDGERPHVVLLFLESFRAHDVGALGAKMRATPRFDALASEGVLFSRFYANGVQTARAVIASLYGVLPRGSKRPLQSERPDFPLRGLPEIFAERGYHRAYLHNGSLSFERKTEFFGQHAFETVHGYQHIATALPEAEPASWGVHDEHLMRYAARYLERVDASGEPAFLTMFSVSHHHPWEPPAGHVAPTPSPPGNAEYGAFLRTLHYTDHCLGLFVELLAERGLADKTILVVLADTAQPMGEHDGNHMLLRNLYEENLRVPLLVLAPGRLREPAVVDVVGSQVDLLPTLLDVLGWSATHHAVGSSLRRADGERTAYFNNPHGGPLIGARRGRFKLVYDEGTGARALFDLETNPGETRDVSAKNEDVADALQSSTRDVFRAHEALYRAEAFAPRAAVQNR